MSGDFARSAQPPNDRRLRAIQKKCDLCPLARLASGAVDIWSEEEVLRPVKIISTCVVWLFLSADGTFKFPVFKSVYFTSELE